MLKFGCPRTTLAAWALANPEALGQIRPRLLSPSATNSSGVVYRHPDRVAKLLSWTEGRVIAGRARKIRLPELGAGRELPLSHEDGESTQAAQRQDQQRTSPRKIH